MGRKSGLSLWSYFHFVSLRVCWPGLFCLWIACLYPPCPILFVCIAFVSWLIGSLYIFWILILACSSIRSRYFFLACHLSFHFAYTVPKGLDFDKVQAIHFFSTLINTLFLHNLILYSLVFVQFVAPSGLFFFLIMWSKIYFLFQMDRQLNNPGLPEKQSK